MAIKKIQVLFHQHYTIMDTMQKNRTKKVFVENFERCIHLSAALTISPGFQQFYIVWFR